MTTPVLSARLRARKPGQGSQARLTSAMAGAAPWQQLTPDQTYFRDQVQGRYQADFVQGAHAPVNAMRHRDDGTTDVFALEPYGDQYLDLGGRGGIDVAAGRQ